MKEEQHKACPYCAEMISSEAVFCSYCKSILNKNKKEDDENVPTETIHNNCDDSVDNNILEAKDEPEHQHESHKEDHVLWEAKEEYEKLKNSETGQRIKEDYNSIKDEVKEIGKKNRSLLICIMLLVISLPLLTAYVPFVLSGLAVGGLIVGFIALFKGGFPNFWIDSRKKAGLLILISMVLGIMSQGDVKEALLLIFYILSAIGMVIGVIALIKGSMHRFGVQSRKMGVVVLLVSLLLFSIVDFVDPTTVSISEQPQQSSSSDQLSKQKSEEAPGLIVDLGPKGSKNSSARSTVLNLLPTSIRAHSTHLDNVSMDDLIWDTDSSVMPDTVVVAFIYNEGNKSRGATFAIPDLFAVDKSGMVFIVGFSRWRETGLFPHPNSSDIRKISQARNPDWYRE